MRSDAQTEAWKRETDDSEVAKFSADRAERVAMRRTNDDNSYKSRSEDVIHLRRYVVPRPSGHNSDESRNALPLPYSPRASVAIVGILTPPKTSLSYDVGQNSYEKMN